MTNSKLFLIFLLICCCGSNLFAQNGANQKIEIENFELNKNTANFFTNEKGLEIELLLHFSTVIESSSFQRYKITWRLEDATGKVLFESLKAKSIHDRSKTAYAKIPFGKDKAPNGVNETLDFFIPYKEIDAKEGSIKCKLILSAEHKVKSLPDFYSKAIDFEFKKIKVHAFEEQTFEVEKLKFKNQTGIGFQKMNIDYEVHLAYGSGAVEDDKYNLYWKLLNVEGQELYNSSQDFFTKNESIRLSSCKEHAEEDTWVSKIHSGVQYKYLNISGKQTMTFVLYIKRNGKLIKIHEAKKTVFLPVLKQYEEQEFTVTNLNGKSSTNKGTRGILLTYNCQFKYNKIDGQRGSQDYYFYIKAKNQEKEVYNPENQKPYENAQEYSWIPYVTISGNSVDKVHSVKLFIPYYLLKTTTGTQNIEISLHATNSKGTVKFEPLGRTKILIDKPAVVKATFELTELSLEEKVYDPVVGNNFEKQKPDTQWFIKAGAHFLYNGAVNTNDYGGLEDKTTLTFSKGDEIFLYIVDHDKLFNPNDILARIDLNYEKKKVVVENYSKNDVKSLSYSLEVNE